MKLWNLVIHRHVKNKWKTTGFLLGFFWEGERQSEGLGKGGQAAALLAQICCSEKGGGGDGGGGGGGATQNFHKRKNTPFFSFVFKEDCILSLCHTLMHSLTPSHLYSAAVCLIFTHNPVQSDIRTMGTLLADSHPDVKVFL